MNVMTLPARAGAEPLAADAIELSIVMPCLNEPRRWPRA